MRAPRVRAAGTLLLVAGMVLAAGCGSPSRRTIAKGTVAAPASELPVLGSAGATPSAGDLGDPFLLTVPAGPTGPARYVLFGTGDWPSNVPTAVSTDLKTWTPAADALPTVPSWSSDDRFHSHIWAPAVLAVGNRWLLYVTVPDPVSGHQCIAVAAADRPEGPYEDALGHPLVCQRSLGGSIDPSIVSTGAGPVLLWKSDGNCCHLPAALWSQQLEPGGLATTGVAHRLLGSDQPWQKGIVEEPAAVPDSHSGWWLFYSAALFDEPDYAIGIAHCTSLAGPCTDKSSKPYAASLPGQRSPGGLETFRDLSGRLRAVFDTWTRPPDDGVYDCCRAIDLATLTGL